MPPTSVHGRNCGCRYWSKRPVKKKSSRTTPNPIRVIPFSRLQTLARIQINENAAAEYPDEQEKSNSQADHKPLLEQDAVEKKKFQIKHRPEHHERHSRKDRKAYERRGDESVGGAAKRQDRCNGHHGESGKRRLK